MKLSRALLPIILFAGVLAFNCLEEPFEYNNPFDPNVPIPPPSDLKIDSMRETFVTLSWKNNLPDPGPGKVSLLRSVVEYAYQKDSTNNYIYQTIDSVSGTSSSVTVIRLFDQATFHAFAVFNILGSHATGISNIVLTGYTQSIAPSNIGLRLVATNDCHILWQDNTSSELGFQLERKIGANDNFIQVAQVPANTTRYEDSAVVGFAGDTIYYRIRAVLPNGYYTPYATSSIYYPFQAPTSLAVQNLNRTSVRLFWIGNVSIGSGFIVERAEKSGPFQEVGRTNFLNVGFIDDSPPDTTKEYYYRVRLFTGGKVSDPSASVFIGWWPDLVQSRTFLPTGWSSLWESPDKSLIALPSGQMGEISVYNSSTYQIYRQFQNAGLKVNVVDIDGADQFVAAGFTDIAQNKGKVRIWRLSDGLLFREWTKPNPVSVAKFSPDGSLIATDGESGSISVVDFGRDSTRCTLPGQSPFAFLRDHSRIAVLGSPTQVYFWNVDDGTVAQDLVGRYDCDNSVSSLKFFDRRSLLLIVAGNHILFGNPYAVTVPRLQWKYIGTLCDLTLDEQYLVGVSNYGLFVIKIDDWCVTSLVLSEYPSAMAIESDGHVLFSGSYALKEYYLQNRWTAALTDPNAGLIQNRNSVPTRRSSHR